VKSATVFLAIAASLPLLASGQVVQPRYTAVDQGPSLVRTLTDTPGLNNRGDVATWHAVTASQSPGLVILHSKETMSIEGDKDFSLVYPADINDQLTVVGILQQPQDLRFTHAFKWSKDHLQILDSLGGPYASAAAINASGEIVGSAQTPAKTRHAVLWRGNQPPRDLGLLAGGDYSSAHDINEKSDIVGDANVVPNGQPQAFLWRAGKMHELPKLPGGTYCTAQAINKAGVITGSCDLPNGSRHGVVWRNGALTDLGTLGDEDAPSTSLDINAQGQVVGTSEATSDHLRAFLWEEGKIINLNKLISKQSGWTLLVASRINDKGEILGRGYYHGAIHAFLLEPISPSASTK
jgi:probable HAF family extracellular repeat protein